MKEICFWSVGNGDYAYMVQALVASFHAAGMQGDFHVLCDQQINGAITHPIGEFDRRGCFFKFQFLLDQVKEWDYRYFIYLDADTLLIRKPRIDLKELLQGDPLHLFLEKDCVSLSHSALKWWGCPLSEYVKLMRECGVTAPRIYHLNAGFFMIARQAIDMVCELAIDFAKYATQRGYPLPDEPAFAYAMHMLGSPERHLLSHSWDIWCSDWEGVFQEQLPVGKPWIFHEYLTADPHLINPAIVHLLRSKKHLISKGMFLQKLPPLKS